jgi:uncharacterized protein YndB with AHSA1/START domain
MSMDKPFRVEVTVDAPRDAVWHALTEPEQIRHWFGWEYDGLEDEIKLIFSEYATLRPPGRIEMPMDGLIELEERGDRTLIRVTKPGDLEALEWKDVYGDIEEGWITFFNQLRHRFATAPDGARRTIMRRGKAGHVQLPGELWHESPYQRGFAAGGELAVLGVKPSGDAMLVVTLYDPSPEDYAAAEARWDAEWARAQAAA